MRRDDTFFIRLCRIGLGLYPRRFRADSAAEMLATLRDREADVRRSARPLELLRFRYRELLAVLRSARRLRRTSPPWTERMRSLAVDARCALKSLRSAPWSTAVVVALLAITVAGNVALIDTVTAVLLRPLPFANADRLVMGQATFGGEINPWASGADYFDYRDQSDVFEALGAIMPFAWESTVTGGGEPERAMGATVSPNLFATLGAVSQRGRAFMAGDGAAGAADTVVLSHSYWQRRFGGQDSALGSTLAIDATDYTVIGVMPASFGFLVTADFWLPMRRDLDGARDRHNWLVVGRLADGVTLREAQAQMDLISARLASEFKESNEDKALLLTDLHEVMVRDVRARSVLLLAAGAVVLLLACANVAGVLLARGQARGTEFAVRAALGASRVRLVRQLLIESVTTALVGGALGALLVGSFGGLVQGLVGLDTPGVSVSNGQGSMAAMVAALSCVVGMLSGLFPALRSTRSGMAGRLKCGRSGIDPAGTRFRTSMVVAQVALSLALLVGSGLLIRSLGSLGRVERGFDATDVWTTQIDLPPARYAERPERVALYTELLQQTRSIPGVRSVGMINNLPIRDRGNRFQAQNPDAVETRQGVFLRSVTPGYLATMNIPLIRGRVIEATDVANAPPVAMINEAAAAAYFSQQDPLGRELVLDYFGRPLQLAVVGVIGDVHMTSLGVDPGPALYLSFSQMPYYTMRMALKLDADPEVAATGLREILGRLDTDVPAAPLSPMQQHIDVSLADRSVITWALTLYAIVPLMLAAIGLYATLTSYIQERRHEIGVRMAIGASPGDVFGMVAARGMRLVGLGVALGLAAAFGVSRMVRAMLYGVTELDTLAFVGAVALVALVAAAACLIPTLRALRLDPRGALKAE